MCKRDDQPTDRLLLGRHFRCVISGREGGVGREDYPSSLLVEMGRKREAGSLQQVRSRIIQLRFLGLFTLGT